MVQESRLLTELDYRSLGCMILSQNSQSLMMHNCFDTGFSVRDQVKGLAHVVLDAQFDSTIAHVACTTKPIVSVGAYCNDNKFFYVSRRESTNLYLHVCIHLRNPF